MPAPVPVTAENWAIMLLQWLLGLIGLIVTAAIPLVVKYLVQRWKLDAAVATQDKIVEIADMAWRYAEEQARKAIKTGVASVPPDRKKEQAMSFAIQVADSFGIPKAAQDGIEKIIEAKLSEGRQDK
jgi:hypothetical protein